MGSCSCGVPVVVCRWCVYVLVGWCVYVYVYVCVCGHVQGVTVRAVVVMAVLQLLGIGIVALLASSWPDPPQYHRRLSTVCLLLNCSGCRPVGVSHTRTHSLSLSLPLSADVRRREEPIVRRLHVRFCL